MKRNRDYTCIYIYKKNMHNQMFWYNNIFCTYFVKFLAIKNNEQSAFAPFFKIGTEAETLEW